MQDEKGNINSTIDVNHLPEQVVVHQGAITEIEQSNNLLVIVVASAVPAEAAAGLIGVVGGIASAAVA